MKNLVCQISPTNAILVIIAKKVLKSGTRQLRATYRAQFGVPVLLERFVLASLLRLSFVHLAHTIPYQDRRNVVHVWMNIIVTKVPSTEQYVRKGTTVPTGEFIVVLSVRMLTIS